jgi:hypothetical protein
MFSITSPELPTATFFSRDALLRHAGERLRYESIVQQYAKDRDECALWDDLTKLGHDADDIRWHIDHPGQRIDMGYL